MNDRETYELAVKYLQHDLDTNIDVYDDTEIEELGELIDIFTDMMDGAQ